MSSQTYITVTFNCTNNEAVAALAGRHRHLLEDQAVGSYCATYLKDLERRSGENRGSKGGLSVWGYVGSASLDIEAFVRGLMGFWSELLAGDLDGGPFYTENIVFLYEYENTHRAECFEVGFSQAAQEVLYDHYYEKGRRPDPSAGDVIPTPEVRHFDLPFSWRP